MVFILLGPPTYGGPASDQSGEDTNQDSGMSSATARCRIRPTASPDADRKQLVGPDRGDRGPAERPEHEAPESAMNYQEVWHYRKELLPKGVSYLQVDDVSSPKRATASKSSSATSDILTTLSASKKKPE